jgi:hypothetical protein
VEAMKRIFLPLDFGYIPPVLAFTKQHKGGIPRTASIINNFSAKVTKIEYLNYVSVTNSLHAI